MLKKRLYLTFLVKNLKKKFLCFNFFILFYLYGIIIFFFTFKQLSLKTGKGFLMKYCKNAWPANNADFEYLIFVKKYFQRLMCTQQKNLTQVEEIFAFPQLTHEKLMRGPWGIQKKAFKRRYLDSASGSIKSQQYPNFSAIRPRFSGKGKIHQKWKIDPFLRS